MLSRNPAAYASLEAKLEEVLAGRAVRADDVPRLPYGNAVIKEALRCYPVAWLTARTALADMEIAGYPVPS